MGLFQKRPDIGNNLPSYSIGLQRTLLVVGLGNVGTEYNSTRHNIGFASVDALAKSQDFDPWTLKKDLRCHFTSKTISDNRVIIIKPTTLMNLSGESVQAVMSFYKIPLEHITAVYDELDIDFGTIRTRIGGGSAGHNGVKSLTQHCGEAFGRVRIGIGPKHPEQIDSSDFVLGKFSKAEQQQIPNLLQETSALLSEYIYSATLPTETRRFIV
jgi:PTH1 family peptidyl-tRNA hydrolase